MHSFRHKEKRNAETLFQINLAVANLLVLTTTVPMTWYSNFCQEWVFGQIGKSFQNSLTTFTMCATK